jgi:biopolymer transport protein ExbD
MFYLEQKRKSPLLQLAPMIDVVFLLLIFFMVATTFPDDLGIEIDKPAADTAQPVTKDKLIFAISKEQDIYYAGKRITRAGAEKILSAAVQQKKKVTVIVHIDKAAPTNALIQFLDLTRKTGVSSIAVGVKQDD